jgi:DeoR/GlpR family transcriptional regulator of sugar metabolism
MEFIMVFLAFIDSKCGLTAYSPDEAAINAIIAEQAKQRIVVAGQTKLGVVVQSLIGPLDAIHHLITDYGASDEMVAPFEQRGIEVRRV